jgi:glycine/serine hydroxymethyltransferase
MAENDTRQVSKLIVRTLSNIGDESALSVVGDEVRELGGRFPVPGLDEE